MGFAVGSSHVVSATPSSSEEGLLTLFLCLSVGPSRIVQSFRNRLLQCGSPWVTSPARKPASVWASLSTGPQVLVGACSSMGSPWGHSLLQAYICSSMGSSTGYRWISVAPWTSMGCRATVCVTMVFIMSYKGRLSAPVSQAPPPPPFFTDHGVCRVVSLT